MKLDAVLRDPSRLKEISDLGLISDSVDPILQEFLAKVSRTLRLDTALVSIVLDSAQYFTAHRGLTGWIAEARGTPVEWSFCQHTVAMRAPFVVEDASIHPLMKDSPLVTLEGVRSYIGIPLITRQGNCLGALCSQSNRCPQVHRRRCRVHEGHRGADDGVHRVALSRR